MLKRKNLFLVALQILLAILSFFTITIAGVQWLNKNPLELSNFALGIPYSFALLAILSAHEFGHYFAARIHSINTTLPFYIPAPPFLVNPFGTMGAVIRIREPLTSKKVLYDIGIAGPLAGLIVTFGVLLIGFITLPDKSYLYTIHPEYLKEGFVQQPGGFAFGQSIFFTSISSLFADGRYIPPMTEIYHYPFLCAGWFGLFITALNLIPIGQLDGGHILYALIGKHQGTVSRVFLGILITLGISSFIPSLPWSNEPSMYGWLFWAAVLYFIIKVDHPPVVDETPLDSSRVILGWTTLGFFLLIFTPLPFAGLGTL